jgi:KaiC/GvpD/RAD55 family RecA-like ATPase
MPFGIKFKGLEKKQVSIARKPRKSLVDIVPIRVSEFDSLIERGGVERGSTLLISGGCGTGKSTFCMQSVYYGCLAGEKAVYILFEESPIKFKRHMMQNFGWDLDKLEREGKLAILRINPFKIARSVEASLVKQRRALLVQVEQLELPFVPDKVVVDSLSALAVAFMGNTENYRYYLKHMFDSLDQYDSVNFVISETEQDPGVYSRTGIEEFLADGVIVLYNIKIGTTRRRVLEILKLRSSNHVKKLVPYQITDKGIVIFKDKDVTQLDESMW